MKTANNVYISRQFNCSIHDLFEWIVKPKLICQWFGPIHLKVVEVKTNIAIGGRFNIRLLKPDGSVFFIEGEYIEIEKPSKLVFSFRYIGFKNTPPDSIVEITLDTIEAKVTNLKLIQKFEVNPMDIANRTNTWNNMFTKLNKKITAAIKGGR